MGSQFNRIKEGNMDNDQRNQLIKDIVRYIKIKFSSRKDIFAYAEDIVNDAFIQLLQSSTYTSDKENFGYLIPGNYRSHFPPSVIRIQLRFKWGSKQP